MKNTKYLAQIDILKFLCITLVIFHHSLSHASLLQIGGPFYIFQAVSIFMILTGYNLTKSYDRKNANNFIELFDRNYMIKRYKRILLPFTIIWAFEILYSVIVNHNSHLSIANIIKTYITGGWGLGSYYTPLLIQIFIFIPILYTMSKKSSKLVLLFSFLVNFIFELIAYSMHMPNSIYKLIFIRYLFAIALGIVLANSYKIKYMRLIVLGAVISLVNTAAINYFGIIFPSQPHWDSRNLYSFLYPFLLVILCFRYFPKVNTNIAVRIMTSIGKASYHIFLIQMLYFWLKAAHRITTVKMIQVPINIIICIVAGYAFYMLELWLRQAWGKHSWLKN